MLRHALLRPLCAASASASSAQHSAAGVSSAAAASSSSLSAGLRAFHAGAPLCAPSGRTAQHRPRNHGARSLPTRTARHDAEWDKVRSHRDPLITTVDPAAPLPSLPLNDLEIDKLAFRYGLAPLPTIQQRMATYSIEQSYYDRRDARIRDHLDRLLRMKHLSKKEMLILIDQVETSKWNLTEMQKAYVPETHHAQMDERDVHRKSLLLGTGGIQNKLNYKKKREEKKAAKKAGNITPPTGDGEPKYGYRRDLANLGPESTWSSTHRRSTPPVSFPSALFFFFLMNQ